MSTALIGVSIIQLLWIQWSLRLNNNSFDERVYIAISHVKEELLEDVETTSYFKDYIDQKKKSKSKVNIGELLEGKDDWQNQVNEYELKSNLLLVDPDVFLENIDIKKLDELIKRELANQSINTKYEYGVFSKKSQSFFILNGNFVVEIGNNSEMSRMQDNPGLKETKFKIPLFDLHTEDEPGVLHIFFPNKSGFVWRNVWQILTLSILFTGLILFCFSYTIYVIFHQKKISEIKNDFINNMTHEFKTPIATISLATDSINSPMIIKDENKIRRFLGIIKEENKRMLNQVEKVLQMAQLDKKEIKIKPVRIDINEIVERAVIHASLKVDERGGEIIFKANANNPQIDADQNHISNIVANLLDNAEKYTTDIPKIIVETNDERDGVSFTVTDNGIGINKESLKHIYEKFYRVHTGNLHDVKGFGLGLTYVKAMVDAHGGKITANSEQGKGTTFKIFLPFKPKEIKS